MISRDGVPLNCRTEPIQYLVQRLSKIRKGKKEESRTKRKPLAQRDVHVIFTEKKITRACN